MKTTIVSIPTHQITDWDTFHTVFQSVFGFPGFYGCNMDAWIDCMTCLDDPSSGMTSIFVSPGDLLALRIDDAADFQRRCPEQYDAFIECAAFVNYRRINHHRSIKGDEQPVLALILSGHFSTPDVN